MKFTEHNEIVMEKFASMIIERIEKMQASDWKQGWIGRTIGEAPSTSRATDIRVATFSG